MIQLLIMLIFGLIAAAIASRKGRSVVGWFFGGFFLGVIGIVIVACLRNLKEEKAYREQTEHERRRLREQLHQERRKGEAFRKFAAERLDVHDRTLGVDTRARRALPAGEDGTRTRRLVDGANPLPPTTNPTDTESALHALARPDEEASESTAPGSLPARTWFYEVNGQPKGPVSESRIKFLMRSKQIGAATLLWTEDLGDWTAASRIQKFRPEVGP